MSIFSSMKKDKKVAAADAPKAGNVDKRFILYSTPLGWHSGMQQADGTLSDLQSGEDVPVEAEGWQRSRDVFKAAVVANAKSIAQAKSISLLLDDFSVQVMDNKPAALTAVSGATARQFGIQLLNVKDVSYGYADLPPVAGQAKKKNSDGVFAFVDAQRMREYLALLDKDGIKVTDAVPKEYLMIQRALHSGEPVYGGFQMSGHTSTLVLVNHGAGIVQVRKIPVGFLTLAKAIAAKLEVTTHNAIQVMAQKNLVADVVPMAANDMENAVLIKGKSLQYQALQPPLTRLLDDVKEFLAFFTFQKVAGVPKQLELFGAFGRVAGLADWLSRNSGVPVVVCEKTMLELFVGMQQPVACNLLKGAESNLLTIGRTRFFYTEDKGFISDQELSIRNQGTVTRTETQHSASGAGPSHTRKRPDRPGQRQRREKKEAPDVGQKLSALWARLHTGKPTGTNDPVVDEEQGKDRFFFALFLLIVSILLYWGYDVNAQMTKQYMSNAASYLQTSTENDQLLKQLHGQETSAQKMGAALDTSKIFWSEKFLALAKNMNEHLWLTDVHLAEDERSVAGVQVKSKTMVIEGHVLPSTDGHVQIIAEYIDNLLRDTQWFMSDFRDVTFQGAEIEGDATDTSGDPQIHFVLRALYDKNKRIETDKKEGESAPAGLGTMLQNTEKHNKDLENVLRGKKDN
ncbi:MAG: hypothetical protein HW380_334 [Magnetococcales bacterium]|nr:hypothetical protein [Magnetococcales bacterium]